MNKNTFKLTISFTILFFLAGLLCFIMGMIKLNNNSNMLDFNEVIENNEKNKYAYINAVGFNSFAKIGDDTFFFVQDNNKYVYIVDMSQETYALIYDEFMNEGDEFEYILKGYSKEVPDVIKQSAIEKFPELGIVNVTIDDNNFNDYLGGLYLDTINVPNKTLYILKICIGGFVSLLSLIGFVITIKKGSN